MSFSCNFSICILPDKSKKRTKSCTHCTNIPLHIQSHKHEVNIVWKNNQYKLLLYWTACCIYKYLTFSYSFSSYSRVSRPHLRLFYYSNAFSFAKLFMAFIAIKKNSFANAILTYIQARTQTHLLHSNKFNKKRT